MKKIIYLFIFIILISCSTLQKNTEITSVEKEIIIQKIIEEQNNLIKNIKENKLNEVKNIFASTLKNNIIKKNFDNIDLSKLLIIFSNEIKIISNMISKSNLLLNYELETYYFDITWKYIDGEWKIFSVEQPKK